MKKIITLICVLMLCSCSYAQNSISMDLKDAPVRSCLEMIFKQAGIKSYVIDNSVAGFVTMTLTEQPFENSLKLVMRANTIPLTYIKENDVYIVKSRTITPPQTGGIDPIPQNTKTNSLALEIIHLKHIDPVDLISVLGDILIINSFNRQKGNL